MCSILMAVIIISLEAVVASSFLPHFSTIKNGPIKGIPVYLMMFLASQIFQVVLCWDALFHQNTIQIIGFVIFNWCCFSYSVFQYVQLNDAIEASGIPVDVSTIAGVLIAMSVVLFVFACLFAWLGFKLYLEFGWKIYKKIGADPRMKNMYRTYQIFLMLLKLDMFFFLAFSVQFLVLVLDPSDPEFALTIVALPCTIFVIVAAVYGLRQENAKIMIFFICGCVLASAYFIFKLARMYQPAQAYKYEHTTKFLTFFATLSLVMVLLTTVNAVVCYMNFGKGLKQHIAISKQTPAATTNTSGDRKMTLSDQ